MKKPLSFIIIGSGWRSLFFARIALKYPDQFCLKYMLCRTPEKALKMQQEYDIPTTTSLEVCEQIKPDFAVVAVSRNQLLTETEKWSRKGAKIQIAEQYRFPVRETDSRYGAITDGSINEKVRTVITMEFEDGKVAFYDFGGVQYHSFIRTRHVNVQGRDGEWNDTMLRYIGEDYLPVTENLTAWLEAKYAPLVTDELLRQSKNWNPSLVLDSEQDEYAIATMMYDMAEYMEDGKEVYPMEEAFLDIEWYFLMQEAVKNSGRKMLL